MAMASLITEDITVAGTHALVIGVSRYPHFDDGTEPTAAGTDTGMEQLSAAARSASEFAAWLMNDYGNANAPLRSLRVFLSPSPGETVHPDIAALVSTGNEATLDNVRSGLLEFKAACDAHADNVLVVYVVGHGVQLTKNGAIVLLSDCGAPDQTTLLERAIDMAGIHAAMNHPGTAKTQFWFVDACRQRPRVARRFERLEGALKLDVPNGDTECSPLFLAATTGTEAFARVDGVTLFNEALMWALRGGVAVGPPHGTDGAWHVPVTGLIRALPDRVRELALAEGAEQSVEIAGKVHEAVLHEYPSAPLVALTVNLLPGDAGDHCTGTLKLDASIVVRDVISEWPLKDSFEAGLYLLNVKADAPFADKDRIIRVNPPATDENVSVAL